MNDVRGYYVMSIHPTTINVFYQPFTPRRKAQAVICESDESEPVLNRQPEQFRDNSHHGKISKVARKKITRSIDYMVAVVPKKRYTHPYYNRAGKFQLNFITLTLSSKQIHSDNEIKSHLLEPFLLACRRKWKVISYIWRAEKQENENLHFHLITDRFIPWNELRNCWNKHQQKLGYVTRYRDNQIAWHRAGFTFRPELAPRWSMASQLQAYKDGILHDWNNPNSTDVHALKSVRDVVAYTTKYILKDDQSSDIQGRLWGCSSNLVKLPGARLFAEGSVSDELGILEKKPGVRKYISDWFTSYRFKRNQLYEGDTLEIMQALVQELNERFPVYRPTELPLSTEIIKR